MESAGLGHVTREISLARALRRKNPKLAIRFFTDGTAGIVQTLEGAGENFRILESGARASADGVQREWKKGEPELFILDSATLYQDSALTELMKTAKSVCVVDQIDDSPVDAELVINALPGKGHGLLIGRRVRGAEYLIQDEDVAVYRGKEKETPEKARKGFAFFGGMDGNDFSAVFVSALALGGLELEWTLLLGPLYPRADDLAARIGKLDLPIVVTRSVSSVAQELWNADVAVLAAGNTLSEAVGVGTPCVCLAQTDEQAANADYFRDQCGVIAVGVAGPAFPYPVARGAPKFSDPANAASMVNAAVARLGGDREARVAMRNRMRGTVDGLGAERVADILLNMMGAT